MSNGSTVSHLLRLGVWVAALAIPAARAQDKPCWLRDAAAPGPQLVFALCEQGSVWSTADGGVNWKSLDTGATGRLRGIAFLDPNRGIAVGDDGLMLVTADAGATWKPQPSGVKEHLMDITFQGESGWVAGFQGTILHSADAGKTWARQTSGTTQTLEAISFLDADHGWAVGWAGAILRTADGGKTWQTVKTPAASWSLTSVYFKNPNEGWVSGFAGQILHTRDGGATWEAQTSPVHGWLTNVSMDRSNRLWITYDDGFLMSEDSGAHWKEVLTPQRYFLGRLIASGGSLWALGQSVLLRQTGNGTEWKKIDSLVPDSTSRLLSAPPTADSTQSKPTS